MSLRKFKLPNLGKKLELKSKLEKELVEVENEIVEEEGDKKVKIIKKKSK